ncbi:MAG: hypothetical protein M3Q39_09740, partial [Actinomycetota bacterium]|nr:hypothetical protein [Actinomycetota bacterium]
SELDKLATDTPIEWYETHSWSGETIIHRLRLGHPRLGRRRSDLRFVVGENVLLEPSVDTTPWASEVEVIGAGEGRRMRRGRASRPLDGRLRRPHVIVDKSFQSHKACLAEAAAELAWRGGLDETTSITLRDSPSAPIGSWVPGDEIRLLGSGEGYAGDLDVWVRVLSYELTPETDTATLTVARAERT